MNGSIEKGREYNKRYYIKHSVEIRKRAKLRYYSNPEKMREYRNRYRNAHPDKIRKANLRWKRKRAGIIGATDAIKVGTCTICGMDTKLLLDHCHKTGRIRGWLCVRCNTGLGMFGDSAIILTKAVSYLRTNAEEMEEE